MLVGDHFQLRDQFVAEAVGWLAEGQLRYRETVVEYLAPFDDGSPTSPGTAPE